MSNEKLKKELNKNGKIKKLRVFYVNGTSDEFFNLEFGENLFISENNIVIEKDKNKNKTLVIIKNNILKYMIQNEM